MEGLLLTGPTPSSFIQYPCPSGPASSHQSNWFLLTVLPYTALHCTILHCTTLYYPTLHYTVPVSYTDYPTQWYGPDKCSLPLQLPSCHLFVLNSGHFTLLQYTVEKVQKCSVYYTAYTYKHAVFTVQPIQYTVAESTICDESTSTTHFLVPFCTLI